MNSHTSTHARRLRLAVVLAVPALFAAACGSSDDDAPGDNDTGAPSASSDAVVLDVHEGDNGKYLTDGSGRTLYLLTADKGSTSSCYDACASAWPPLTAKGKPEVEGDLEAEDVGTTKRTDGTMQVTFYGHPLYYFVKDTGPDTVNGQGIESFGGTWWLVAPTGDALTDQSSPSSSTSDDTGGY